MFNTCSCPPSRPCGLCAPLLALLLLGLAGGCDGDPPRYTAADGAGDGPRDSKASGDLRTTDGAADAVVTDGSHDGSLDTGGLTGCSAARPTPPRR